MKIKQTDEHNNTVFEKQSEVRECKKCSCGTLSKALARSR